MFGHFEVEPLFDVGNLRLDPISGTRGDSWGFMKILSYSPWTGILITQRILQHSNRCDQCIPYLQDYVYLLTYAPGSTPNSLIGVDVPLNDTSKNNSGWEMEVLKR